MQQCFGCWRVQDHIAELARGDAAVTKLLSEESWANGICATWQGRSSERPIWAGPGALPALGESAQAQGPRCPSGKVQPGKVADFT